MSSPRISMGDLVAEFCQQDAYSMAALRRAADAILIPTLDRRGGGSFMSTADFAVLKEFLAFAEPEFAAVGILTREQFKPDLTECAHDGDVLKLSGELA